MNDTKKLLLDRDEFIRDQQATTERKVQQPTWASQRSTTLSYDYDHNIGLHSTSMQPSRNAEVYQQCLGVGEYVSTSLGPHFRLLQIQPDSDGSGHINAKLLVKPVFDAPDYIALSYAWGEGPHDHEITISGKPFFVSSHLHQALAILRSSAQAVNIWVDAICINQRDIYDKSCQIHIMAQIFNQAAEVRIWLGAGFDFLEDDFTGDDVVQKAVSQGAKWWRRLWVVQEVAYASASPLFMTADKLIRFDRFMETEHPESVAFKYSALAQWRKSIQQDLRLAYACWKQSTPRIPLLQLLRDTAGREYTVPHDRVYALLDLMLEEEQAQIKPDYRKPYRYLETEIQEYLSRQPSYTQLDATLLKPSTAQARPDYNVSHLSQVVVRQDTQAVSSMVSTYFIPVIQQCALTRQPLPAWMDKTFEEAFSRAVYFQFNDILQVLLDAHQARCLGGVFVLAAANGHLDVMQMLMDNGAATDPDGHGVRCLELALLQAVNANWPHIVKYLADLRVPRDRAIFLARSCRDDRLFQLLSDTTLLGFGSIPEPRLYNQQPLLDILMEEVSRSTSNLGDAVSNIPSNSITSIDR